MVSYLQYLTCIYLHLAFFPSEFQFHISERQHSLLSPCPTLHCDSCTETESYYPTTENAAVILSGSFSDTTR